MDFIFVEQKYIRNKVLMSYIITILTYNRYSYVLIWPFNDLICIE